MGGQASARSPLTQGLPEQYIPDQSIIENSKPLGQGLPVGIPLLPVYVLTRHIGKLQGTRGHVGRALAWEIFPRIWSRRGAGPDNWRKGGRSEGLFLSPWTVYLLSPGNTKCPCPWEGVI